jgi:hypothetical protein
MIYKTMQNLTGNLCTHAAALLLFGFGMAYLMKNSFMPYHSEAVSLQWEQIEPNARYLYLALMRAASGGFISTAFVIVFLQVKLHKYRIPWIPALILAMGTIMMACLVYAIVLVSSHTPGRPPAAATLAGEVLLIAGFIFNRKFLKKKPDQPQNSFK